MCIMHISSCCDREWNQLYMKGKHKLHILYEYQLNTYLTVDYVVK